MSNAYIIEVGSHTAGIVTKDERSYRFISSDRIFDRPSKKSAIRSGWRWSSPCRCG
jgi:hypothetical protein